MTYRKVGDHATALPASEYFSDYKQQRYARTESIKYEYDNMNNLSKVYENTKLAVRYTYDKLNRLVREDNKKFGKTWTFAYDNVGNIINKSEYAFTLINDLELCEQTPVSSLDYNTYKINK